VPESFAVWFDVEATSLAAVQVHRNLFEGVTAGIFVDPANLAQGPVDGACNWWGSASGPGPVGPGAGALVSPKVAFSPWLVSPDGPCL
jgi:hypothetical protein